MTEWTVNNKLNDWYRKQYHIKLPKNYETKSRLYFTAAYSPFELFSTGSVGLWLDPSDVANLAWRRNLLTWTEDLRNTAETGSTRPWTISAGPSVVTPNYAAAPDGTNTASRITFTASDYPGRQQNYQLTAGTTYTFSVYIKRISGPNTGRLEVYGLGVTTAIVSINATSAWTRVSVTATATASGIAGAYIYPEYSAGATGEYHLWGAQLELGTVATDYQRISDVNTEVIERFPTATMYQDAAGTTPVTTPGQPVGLRLDKSKGLVLGAELVTNGDFSAGTTGWTLWSNTTVSGGAAVFNYTSFAALLTGVGVSVVAGRTYRVTYTIVSRTSGSIRARVGNTDQDSVIPAGASAGTYSFRIVAAATQTDGLLFIGAGDGFIGTVDNISVRELPGNHATQSVLASRPVYGIEPAGGRRNLLTWSEGFDNAAWSLDNSGATNPIVTANYGAAPDGAITADRVQLNKTGGVFSRIYQGPSLTTPSIGVFSVWMKNNAAGTANVGIRLLSTALNCAVTSVWQRFSIALASPESILQGQILLFDSIIGNDETADILVWGAQLELGSTPTAYQRVTTAFDVTEAGVQSCHYVQYDGSDDGMITNSIDFTATDKMSVFAGVRKLSDATAGIFAELGASGTVAGGFKIGTGTTLGDAGRRTWLVGQGNGGVEITAGVGVYPSPDTRIQTGLFDRAGATLQTEVQMRLDSIAQTLTYSTTDLVTDNFGNYPFYLGRRGGTTAPFNGRDYGIVVVGKATTAAEITATERWLSGKTGFYAPIITGVPTIGVS